MTTHLTTRKRGTKAAIRAASKPSPEADLASVSQVSVAEAKVQLTFTIIIIFLIIIS